ncbi:hypothetical protein Bca4012_005047 [Brassica carinata]|uniref:Uncharacterized protein n=1 Tax=Brassica oleracea TaxID=3712 RepID=A0A3P6AL53_BRAOL|nr:unnamed protein product [Brassica oleracea]
MMTYNTPMSLLSLTEDVTRTFVPGEQLRVNIERDRRLEEGTAAQVLVGCRIISPNWWRSWSSTDPARRKGTCDDVQLGSWKREATRRTNWWRSWSSTDPARRKGTCDDVQLGSWKREATRRTNNHGKLKLGSYEAYDREIKAGACLRITKRRGWSIAQLQWNMYSSTW